MNKLKMLERVIEKGVDVDSRGGDLLSFYKRGRNIRATVQIRVYHADKKTRE